MQKNALMYPSAQIRQSTITVEMRYLKVSVLGFNVEKHAWENPKNFPFQNFKSCQKALSPDFYFF